MSTWQVKIDAFLSKNHIIPLFPYEPNKTVHTHFATFSWQNNYSTFIKKDGREYFMKININSQYLDDLEKQVLFMQLLQKHQLSFIIPHVYEWSFDKTLPYYIAEKIDGETLGNSVRTKEEYMSNDIINILIKGLDQIKTLENNSTHWYVTKNQEWLLQKLYSLQHDEKIISIIGKKCADTIHQTILDTKYSIIHTPLWGDPAPNNIIVTHDYKCAMIDFKPFTIGYQHADIAEFASFCVFSQKGQAFLSSFYSQSPTLDLQQFNAFYLIFLIDRLYSILWLEKREQLEKQLENPKEYYIDKIVSELKTILTD